MPLVQLLVVLIVFGLVLYLIEAVIPLDPTLRLIIRVVILIAVCLWLLSAVGILTTVRLRG